MFNLCSISVLVQNAEALIRLSRNIFGDFVTNSILKMTLFGHFCAGEDEDCIHPVLEDLQSCGIGGILDYAAESGSIPQTLPSSIEYKTYDVSEAIYDKHAEVFRGCVRAVQKIAPDGFAAVKVSALANPKLLERMSAVIVDIERLFTRLDLNGDGVVTMEELEKGSSSLFKNKDDIQRLANLVDPGHSGRIDYISWLNSLQPGDFSRLSRNCRDGSLARNALTNEELGLIDDMFRRAYVIAEEAAQRGTRVLIDAEQVRFQPAIDTLVLDLQHKYNAVETTSTPLIFNTYQCYRRDALDMIQRDVRRSERYNYHFGAKLVRGAYMESERALAAVNQYPSPIHDTIEDTHRCFNEAVDWILRHSIKTDKKVELLCATHNQESIEKALHTMGMLGIRKQDGTVRFAQLFGMSDSLTFNLGNAGYNAFKYLPYGQVHEVIPYLLRRAKENDVIVGNAGRELKFLKAELFSRIFPWSSSLH